MCGEITMSAIRWSVTVSSETDRELRMFLASRGGGKKGDLSNFIEESVKAHILELTIEQAKLSNKGLNESDIMSAVDEAILWARKNR